MESVEAVISVRSLSADFDRLHVGCTDRLVLASSSLGTVCIVICIIFTSYCLRYFYEFSTRKACPFIFVTGID